MKEFGIEYGRVCINETEHLEKEAEFAASMVEKWGIVAGMPDGEDSSGRAKGRVMTPEELVERAFSVATLFYAEAKKRGLVAKSPTLQECHEAKKKERD